MSKPDNFDWAEVSGKEAAARESKLRAKQESDVAQKSREQQMKAQEESDFRKKAEQFTLDLSNKVQFAVNSFNRGVTDGTQIDSPVPLGSGLGFYIAKPQFASNLSAPMLKYPSGSVRTLVEIDTPNRTMIVHHAYNSKARLDYISEKERESYLLLSDDSAQLQIKTLDVASGVEGEAVEVAELVKRICLPLFHYVGQPS